ncbi:MAG: type II toxin-antitoxin system YafQ family toxin [Melioribacteraceae bacterium]|nr:type II toxin-antitoxin system YafQ family toxin [Melioribacteraceae bacterium]MCF8356916.1 type II toxin-antitoxin system YafQ family toxin [Melioribacteraceae bacterium]MCF8394109.1 type II toxin-antitoxin system YafQ family toxin [Melioribacteraceae bacterium]MCF8418153.1 type II toxin-antitoxin system YafQ family toxin [Melioribacteraceae bacterium]
MLEIRIEKSFKKDIQRDKKSGKYSDKDFELLKSTIISLQNQKIIIQPQHKRHSLKGDLKTFESIHVKNDWLLIFKIDEKYLDLVMLGKHSQVYKKFK